jgi:hypothetical protein
VRYGTVFRMYRTAPPPYDIYRSNRTVRFSRRPHRTVDRTAFITKPHLSSGEAKNFLPQIFYCRWDGTYKHERYVFSIINYYFTYPSLCQMEQYISMSNAIALQQGNSVRHQLHVHLLPQARRRGRNCYGNQRFETGVCRNS